MRRRPAFTLVEVTLVIAITAIIFLAFIISVSGSIASQRYSDSTQNFAEFLRGQYSAVINVQNNGFGNTSQAIYGRLITFGEKDNNVYTYDIIGAAYNSDQLGGNKSIIASLKEVSATVLYEDRTDATCYLRPVNEASYNLTHGAWLETTEPRDGQGSGEKFTGSLIIARSPVSGNVSTIYNPYIIKVQDQIGNICVDSRLRILSNELDDFEAKQLDFCIASDDQPDPNVRRDVRIIKDGKGTSAVQILGQEDGGNLCNS